MTQIICDICRTPTNPVTFYFVRVGDRKIQINLSFKSEDPTDHERFGVDLCPDCADHVLLAAIDAAPNTMEVP